MSNVPVVEKDRLTGVYSRDYFDVTSRKIVDSNPDIPFVIIELDINRLTVINELYGVSEGDNVLKYMGTTLCDVFSDVDNSIYARIQADLFAILCPYDKVKIDEHIEKIESAMHKYSLMLNIDILLSFGIYKCIERDVDMQIQRDRAKLALKTVKGNYINHVAYYDSSMHDKMAVEQDIIQNMFSALENREFVVFYQPKHSLDDDSIIGAEALVRWKSPDKGLISPGLFIPIFESNGFIMKLDYYVWDEACRFIKEQLDKGVNLKPVSVNISRINLYNPELVSDLVGLINKYEIPFSMLDLEFTESAYTDNPQLMLQTMDELQKAGFRVEMDDFGSGYSSLNMLKDVPVDVLKIDLNFLSKTSNSEKAITIMSSVLRMAKWLGIPSIVEGVETLEQIDYLKSIGCTTVQGYFFSKPLPEDEYIKYIELYDKREKVEKTAQNKRNDVLVVHPNEIWNMISGKRNEDFPIFDAYGLFEETGAGVEAIRVSDSYFDLFCTTRKEYFGKHRYASECVIPEDLPRAREMIKEASEINGFGMGVFRIFCGDGSIKSVYCKAKLLGTNVDGDARVFYLGYNDITKLIDR